MLRKSLKIAKLPQIVLNGLFKLGIALAFRGANELCSCTFFRCKKWAKFNRNLVIEHPVFSNWLCIHGQPSVSKSLTWAIWKELWESFCVLWHNFRFRIEMKLDKYRYEQD